MVKKLGSQVIAFATIGSIGFAIDGVIVTVLSVSAGINIYTSRLISFLLASLTTWLLNRQHTFRRVRQDTKISTSNEYIRYIVIQIGGSVINLSVFTWLVATNPALQSIPIMPLAAGASVALVFNFLGARLWVYK